MTKNQIVIDEENALIFDSEEELYAHFNSDIELLEKAFFLKRAKSDFSEQEQEKFEKHLEVTLDAPDEVWHVDLEGLSVDVYAFIREFKKDFYYVALTYLTGGETTFVFSHFATKDKKILKELRKGEEVPVRDHTVAVGAIEGDSLYEGDPLAKGLYEAMILLRSDKDIPEADFQKYAEMREACVESADEIWRSADSLGNILVTFIRESEDDVEPHYVVVTVEDEPSGSHSLLFSFPTNDPQLLERYRHGENLQADEVVQESSH